MNLCNSFRKWLCYLCKSKLVIELTIKKKKGKIDGIKTTTINLSRHQTTVATPSSPR